MIIKKQWLSQILFPVVGSEGEKDAQGFHGCAGCQQEVACTSAVFLMGLIGFVNLILYKHLKILVGSQNSH